jgi:hypothetical protein
MKDFTRSAGRLRALPLPARVVYSVFLAFTGVGLGFSAWLGAEMVGSDLGGVHEYYAGGSAPRPEATEKAAAGGPALDLPEDALAPAAADAIPLRKLLEVTHFHLFSMPIYLMVLSHLFMLSSLGPRHKSLWIVLASVAVGLHIAAPWLARTGHGLSTLVYGVSGALLVLTFLVLGGVPLFEMWQPRRQPPGAAPGEP